jgi:hypothetical protein
VCFFHYGPFNDARIISAHIASEVSGMDRIGLAEAKGSCEGGNEPSGSIKYCEVLE